jgi:hypothetical protein
MPRLRLRFVLLAILTLSLSAPRGALAGEPILLWPGEVDPRFSAAIKSAIRVISTTRRCRCWSPRWQNPDCSVARGIPGLALIRSDIASWRVETDGNHHLAAAPLPQPERAMRTISCRLAICSVDNA